MKTTVCIFGVNGVGKSSIIRTLELVQPQPITILHGSSILKESLGVASYQELESRDSQQKKRAYIRGVSAAVAEVDRGVVIVDTHLVVPVWTTNKRRLEDMWDNSLRSVFDGFIYVTGPPAMVSERRSQDASNCVRSRRCDEYACARDLSDNDARWDEVSASMSNAWVVVNDTTITCAVDKLWSHIQECRKA